VRILRSFELDISKTKPSTWVGSDFKSAGTLENLRPTRYWSWEADLGHPYVSVHRVDLHSALREHAIGDHWSGKPVVLRVASKVETFDGQAGRIVLADGSTHRADLLIAADGLHSQAASHVNGRDCPTVPSNATVMRFLISADEIRADPVTAPILEGPDGSTFVSYPQVLASCTHPALAL
jgi:salicylate hydroxylase